MLSSSTSRVADLQAYIRTTDAATVDAVMASLAAYAAAGAGHRGEGESSGPVSPFSSKFIPPLSLVAYGRRLLKYCYCAPHGVLIGVVLLCRYCKATRHRLTPHTVHRLLLTSVVVALKTHFDVFYSNQYYAQVGGITTAEINRLEVALLDGLHFGATATLEELAAVTQRFSREAARIPLDRNCAPVSADRLSPPHAAEMAAAQREIVRAAYDSVVAPAPFRCDEPRHAPSASPAPSSRVQPGRTVTVRVTGAPSEPAAAASHAAQRAVPRATSAGSGLDADYIDSVGARSHTSSRRDSATMLA